MNRFLVVAFFAVFSLISQDALAQTVVRGPYLQLQTDNSISIHWRTDVATDSVVRFGTDSNNLDTTVSVGGSRTEHVVAITGLSPLTQYFYGVGAGGTTGDPEYFLHTAPVIGNATPTRFWVIGDSGTAVTHPGQAIAVKNAFKAYSASSPADFMIMLGDNAYNDGTDTEYQNTVFNVYPELFRQMPVWSTLGNHDGHSADSTNQTGPYYDIFEFPKAGEVGGLASFTEAYYSFDYGDIHFVNLDSYDTDRSANGNMMQWLESDLAINDKPWVIAIWHHPPYTKGSHNSDTESQLVDMRQNALPILEAWGVDLVMSGHSHSYERSYLLDGHYGVSTTLDPVANVLDPGDGKIGSDGAYEKPDIIAAEHAGAVYAVAGSSGKISAAALNHPAMYVGLVELGSMVIDIAGNRLDAVFIDETGTVLDEFSVMKTPDIQAPLIEEARAEDGTHVIVDYTERVDSATATDVANYAISGLSISNAALLAGNKSVRLTTSAMTPGQGYVLTVNNVMDDSGNTIAANSQYAFSFVQQVTQFFQDGLAPTPAYDGTADTFIRQASATTNYGSDVTLQVDGDEPAGAGTDMSILIAWDVSEIPASATIDAVNIHLNTLNVGGPYYCYALNRAWDQNQANWNQAASGSAWGAPGAAAGSDRDGSPLCTVNTGTTGALLVALNVDGVALVQSWVEGTSPNNGIIIADPVSNNGADFDSSESASAMNRPKLEVVYTVPVDPPNQPPTAAYTYSCLYLACDFTDASTDSDGTVTGWAWDFGDGNSSNAQDPSHAFASAGSYTVSLTATDDQGGMNVDSQSITVTAPPPPNNPPNAGYSFVCDELACDFTDTSSDSDGTIASWVWDFGDASNSNAQNPSHTFASDGTYTVELTVTDNEGATDLASQQVVVSTPPLVTDVVANADLLGSGSVSGTFADTHSDGNGVQTIQERQSGGKKNNRYSYLEHTWQFSLPANAMATLHSNAWSGGSADDQFQFSWSADNVSFNNMFVVSSTNPQSLQSFILPANTSGPVYVRVRDTDQTAGNNVQDTVFVDHMYIRVESGAGDPPAAPTSLNASAAGASQINLVWTDNASDESGYKVERSTDGAVFSETGTAGVNATGFSDSGLNTASTYWYRVRAWNASGNSSYSNIDSATTDSLLPPAPPGVLNAVPAGSSSMDLTWQDNSANEEDFQIERSLNGTNFSLAATVAANTTGYTDTGLNAATTYWYRVRARNAGGNSAFSNTASATTDAAPLINLSLNGYKIKGKHTVDLTWNGAVSASVDIIRDGSYLRTVSNTGTHTDNTGQKGGRTYTYQVCEAGTSDCSPIQSVVF